MPEDSRPPAGAPGDGRDPGEGPGGGASEPVFLTCDVVDELAGAYALDAVPDAELAEIEAHLAACRQNHQSLRELSATASLLALACDEAEPPPALRRRIHDLAVEDSAPAAPVPLPAPAPRAKRRAQGSFGGRVAASGWLLAAAVLAALAIGLAAWGLGEHAQLHDRATALRGESTVLTALAQGATVVQLMGSGAQQPALLVQPRDGAPAYLVVDAPRLANDKVYEAWYINGSRVVLAGSFSGAVNGPQVVQLRGPIGDARAVAVTIEPKGSTTPTGPKILQRTLS